MDYYAPLFFIPSTTGLIFIVAGFLMLKFPPKKINYLYGYRTRSSMKDQERWDFSQKYSSNLMIKYGLYMVICSLLGLVIQVNATLGTILGIGLLFIVVIFLIINTEKALKEKFRD